MSESFHREEELFAEALNLPEGDRTAFLDRACAADPDLRAKVQALLDEHARPAGPFDRSVLEREIAPEGRPSGVEAAGDRVDRYRLIEQIGEGGWGVVWRAEQEEPVRREVALKIIKPGMDTRAVITRFEAERQALALMDHPGIARVFDAGATAQGRPYFVMELVRGSRITDYCDEQKLDTAARLRLFMEVCAAIQHAHQKGVIHRDIKPSNILVTQQDGAPVAKVIDFGIAKATQGRLVDQTMFTAFERFVGTPAYMSPEQAEPTTLDVDTRSDIYSLGVLLYELLTGCTPFEAPELLRAGVDAMRRIIRETEPPRPSARLATLDPARLTVAATRRQTEPPRLVHAVRGDLDWIVMRSLEKDRQRRYATALDLAADVGRHLEFQPVVARSPGTWYRLGRFVRRHRVGVAATAIVLLALVGGLAAAYLGFRRAVAAREEAEAVTNFLSQTLAAANPANGGNKDVTVRAVLDAAVPQVAVDFPDRPILRARLHEVIGATYGGLGLFEASRDQYQETLALRTRELGPRHELTLRVGLDYAEALSLLDEVPQAEKNLRAILAVYDARPGDYPAADRGWACFMIGNCLATQGREADALEFDQRAADIFAVAFGPWHVNTLKAKGNVIGYYTNTGQAHKSRPMLEDVIAHANLPPDSATYIIYLLDAAVAESATGDYALAEQHIREAERRSAATFGEEYRLTLNARYLLGDELVRQGHVDEGLQLLERTTGVQSRVFGAEESGTLEVRAALANALGAAGRYDESLQLYRDVLSVWPEKRGQDAAFFIARREQAHVSLMAGHAAEAEASSRSALADMVTAGDQDEYTRAGLRLELAQALVALGRGNEAETVLLESHAALRALDFDVRPQIRQTRAALAALYEARGDAANAAGWRADETVPAGR